MIKTPILNPFSQPAAGILELEGPGIFAGQGLPHDHARTELRRLFQAGQLDKITLTAVVFRACYPNANFFKFRDEDLQEFAASFAEAPFLRNHDITDVGARAGTVRDSWLASTGEIIQQIEVTVPRDIEAVLNQQIDRFSISWFWSGITCSVCGQDWYACNHWPGRQYTVNGATSAPCELIFETPRGRETSAVNTPAVAGTGIESVSLDASTPFAMENTHMEPQPVYQIEGNTPVPAAPATSALPGSDPQSSEVAELLAAQRDAILDTRLAGAGLPAELADLVRQSLPASWKLADLDVAIARARDAWARLEESRTVQGVPARIGGMRNSIDQLTDAFEALATGRPAAHGTPPLSGLREFYLLLSGDYNMTGMFQPDNVGLANVTTTTMASIVANVMNKVVAMEF